jgi:hypothetical protein
MFSYFIDYNKNKFEEKTFLDLIEVIGHIADWKTKQTAKSLSQIERLVNRNKKLQDLFNRTINVRSYDKLYFAKRFSDHSDAPTKGDVIRREDSSVYSWTHSSACASQVADYKNGHKKPNSGGVVAKANNVKKEDILIDVARLFKFTEEIFNEVDETDLKIFLKKVQGNEYNKDTIIDLLSSYHILEQYANKEQEILVSATPKNNKCIVIAWYKHEDGVFREEGWNTL